MRLLLLALCTTLIMPVAAFADDALSGKENLTLTKYLGLWYEMGRTPNENQDNQPTRDGKKYSVCYETTATYTPGDEGSVNLRNVCVRYAEDGSRFEDSITGAAKIFDPVSGRKLGVAFGSGFAQFFQRLISGGGFDYWIYRVGPENAQGLYSWALVSGSDKGYLFVLTREPSVDETQKAQILQAAQEEGLPVDRLVYRQQRSAQK